MNTKSQIWLILAIVAVSCAVLVLDYSVESFQFEKEPGKRPNDWFFKQRAYPHGRILHDKVELAREQALSARTQNRTVGEAPIEWELVGPTNIPGRLTDIAVHPDDTNTVYAGSASGGVFKSTDRGQTWLPVFDDIGVMSIGAVEVSPGDPQTIYVGTGEVNPTSYTYEGNGIYKSTDGGTSWSHIGLTESYHIGRIVVDSIDNERIFAAVMGNYAEINADRGVYRSIDGGQTWDNCLYVSDSTGCIDLAQHPSTGTLFAAMWEYIRNDNKSVQGGSTCGIYRSTNYGDSWQLLTSGLPPQSLEVGRIGISVAFSTEDVYAIYADTVGDFMGLFRSADLGDTWTQTNDGALANIYGPWHGGWYFGNVRVSPRNSSLVFALGLDLYQSTNFGDSWYQVADNIHVDHHAMEVVSVPIFPPFLYQDVVFGGCDGGAYYSPDYGFDGTYVQLGNMAVTQFYAITVDYNNPERVYGGTQDNGTIRTPDGSVDQWEEILNADGFMVLVDYTDPDVIYAEQQDGVLHRSTNGGASFEYITPIQYGVDRHNWNTPIAMDPIDPNTIYYGSNFLYRSTNRGDSWEKVSPDLTDGTNKKGRPSGTLTTIAIAQSDPNIIYCGTDDANIWATDDGGSNWNQRNSGLPDRWVTRVSVDYSDAAIVYATFSGYFFSDLSPHVFRSTNHGTDWVDIHGDLPDFPVNDIVVNPADPSALFIATDFGVYHTSDLGLTWAPYGEGLPMVPVTDLGLHVPTATITAGTYGRSAFRASIDCVADGYTVYDGDEDGALMGNAVAMLGDVNDDGVPDYAFAAPGDDLWGKVYIISGFDNGTITTIDEGTGTDFAYDLATLDDVDGDGLRDLAVAARSNASTEGLVFIYSSNGWGRLDVLDGTAIGEYSFAAIDAAGDVDGDGLCDIVIGDKDNDDSGTNAGKAYVYSIAGDSVVHAWTGETAGDGFGYSVSSAGDVNNDGYDDIMVGAPFNDEAFAQAGKVYIFSGSDGSILQSFLGESSNHKLGVGLSELGDIDDDQVADVLVGAETQSSYGKLYLFSSGEGTEIYSRERDVVGYFGREITDLGDVDFDGYADFAVGSPIFFNPGPFWGKVDVFSGQFGVILKTMIGEEEGDVFGSSLDGGSGFGSDCGAILLTGAPAHDISENDDRGRAYVFDISYLCGGNLEDSDADGVPDPCDECPGFDDEIDVDNDGIADICDNCPLHSNSGQHDSDGNGVGNACTFSVYSPAAENLVVFFDGAQVFFDNVTTAGITTLEIIAGDPGIDGYQIVPLVQPFYFNISTTAEYTGTVRVCLNYAEYNVPAELEATLTIHHFDGFDWSDVTTHRIPFSSDICGDVTELSPFALALPNPYVCGDADASGGVDIDDVVYLIAYIFSGGPPPDPLLSGDADCSGAVDIDDVVYLIGYIFSGGNAPCDTDGDEVPDC